MPLIRSVATLVLCTLLAACAEDRRTDTSEPAPGSGTTDTSNARAIDGLSRDQIERRAEPLSPQQAEKMGLPTLDPDSAIPSAP